MLILGNEEPTLYNESKVISQLDLAKRWIKACLDTHNLCKLTPDLQLPTRLIDVISNLVRLVLTSSLTTRPSYAVLSHCWGTQQFFNLKENNLEHLMTEIPSEKLTKTFLHSIYITRYLGLKYLWIDSFCIIQDSQKDWLKESALMSSVYGGSAITIAATGAEDGTQGCFPKLPGFIGKVRFKSRKAEQCDIAQKTSLDSVVMSPLVNRAWAFQERLLSPRLLHFSVTELFWECRHCDPSESFPESRIGNEDTNHVKLT